MLSHIGDDHTLLGQTAEKLVKKANRRLGQPSWIKFRQVGTASNGPPFAPIRKLGAPRLAAVARRGDFSKFRMKCRNRIRQIANRRNVAGTNPIELCGITFKVNNLRVRREARGTPTL